MCSFESLPKLFWRLPDRTQLDLDHLDGCTEQPGCLWFPWFAARPIPSSLPYLPVVSQKLSLALRHHTLSGAACLRCRGSSVSAFCNHHGFQSSCMPIPWGPPAGAAVAAHFHLSLFQTPTGNGHRIHCVWWMCKACWASCWNSPLTVCMWHRQILLHSWPRCGSVKCSCESQPPKLLDYPRGSSCALGEGLMEPSG